MRQGARIGAARLWYNQPHKQFYLLVSLEREVTAPPSADYQRMAGVDVGQRYLAVATDAQNHLLFLTGQAACAQAEQYARLRKRLRQKGARSATRRLRAVSGRRARERRLKQECTHRIGRRIVDAYPHPLIGLEDLTHLRERTRRKHGKWATMKQRRANQHVSQWALAELQGCIAYKAPLAGSLPVKVDADKTSYACPRMGTRWKTTAPTPGCCSSVSGSARPPCRFDSA